MRDAAVRIALKRAVKLIKAYTDRRAMEQDEKSSGSSSAHKQNRAALMLEAAFSNPFDESEDFDDPGKIFRLITGGVFKDVDDDGNLVETIVSEDQSFPLARPSPTKLTLPEAAAARGGSPVDRSNSPPGTSSDLPTIPAGNGNVLLPPIAAAEQVRSAAELSKAGDTSPLPRVAAGGAGRVGGGGGGAAAHEAGPGLEEWRGELASVRSEMAAMHRGLSGEMAMLQSGISELKALLSR